MSANPPTGTNRLRAAVICCGWIGAAESLHREGVSIQSHSEAYATHSRTLLSAVVDSSADAVRKAATRWNAEQAFIDPVEMLQAVDPEIVSICTPDALHSSSILTVLNSGNSLRGIPDEKPLALTAPEACETKTAADARGVILGVNYSCRHSPACIELCAKIQGGALGSIQQVHGFYGKGLTYNGTHWIDLLRFLCGKISQIHAIPLPARRDDTSAISTRLQGGTSAILQPSNPEVFTLVEIDLLAEKCPVWRMPSPMPSTTWFTASSNQATTPPASPVTRFPLSSLQPMQWFNLGLSA